MFSFLFGRKRKISGKVASDRLKQLLLSDRIACPTEITDSIRGDIVSALSKYVEIDIQNIDIHITQKGKSESVQVTASDCLCAF